MTHWIAYSEPSAARLARLLKSFEELVVCESVTKIESLTPDTQFPSEMPDLIIVLSQHATTSYFRQFYIASHARATVLAIGPSTAKGFVESGAFMVKVPDETNSEGLLAMPEISALKAHQTVWLLTGEGGRDLVSQSLRERCRLLRFNLYRREKRQPVLPLNSNLQAVWVGSIHGVQQVNASANHPEIDRYETSLVVPSERVADYARGLEWQSVIVCDLSDAKAVQKICARIKNGG